ncbi:MAG TPA: beta-ketoacyl synthase N-terminal-like domain-containing protein, partial [Tepidisphaeraceae bacterium]|nr:beta-ketoacyl synthase N-terminal-like domain-containing protein [Tepidisphaeraceae bacterium]
ALLPDLHVAPGESRAWAAIQRALWPLVGKIDPDTALLVASTVGEIEFVERSVLDDDPALAAESRPQVLVERIRRLLGLRGQCMAISSACASSAAALTRGAAMIRHGEAAAALVVTCDVVSEFVYSGFSTLFSLSAEPARPFDAKRCGLSLGEAAAWTLLKAGEDSGGIAILGWGNTMDAVHMTAPDRNGAGLSRAIAKASAMAQQPADRAAFIAAHGTGTQYSDAMEIAAFGAAVGNPRRVFSIKGGIGHTLAAAGLVQILVAGRALGLGVVPPTIGLCGCDAAATDWVHGEIGTDGIAISTNSGFGGVNTAIVLGGGKTA